jgi:hypothetical protein
LAGKLKVPDDIMDEDETINAMFYGDDKAELSSSSAHTKLIPEG